MKDKVIVELFIPEIEESYDLYLPASKKIGEIIREINKALFDLTDGVFKETITNFLYDYDTGEKYDINVFLKDTNIRNGTKLILM